MDGPVRSVFSEMVRRYQLFVHLDAASSSAWPDGPDVKPAWAEIFKHVAFEESRAAEEGGKARYGVIDIVWDQAVVGAL